MKSAVFFHCSLSGPHIPEGDLALNIFTEQVTTMRNSSLDLLANELHFGVNRDDALLVASLSPPNARMHVYPDACSGERPTLEVARDFARSHPDWAICYFHMKGVSHRHDDYAPWRRCMERVVVSNWRQCLHEIEQGSDMAGAHWLTSYTHPILGIGQRYWGGNFWWSSCRYLNTLPDLPNDPAASGKYYAGEAWIGSGKIPPRVVDHAKHWPQKGCRP